MQRERQNEQNKAGEERKEGYIIVSHYFLKEWVSILGVGPVVLYQELLTYCHKGKYIAWPTINSLCQRMGIAKTTLLRYQNTLARFGLVKNISKGNSTSGHYKNNVYQIIPLEKLPDHRDIRYQNDTYIGSETIPVMVSKRYPNNNNLNITNPTTTNSEKDAVVAVDFKKLKEEGEERMQAVREQLRDLDIEEKFIEQLLKDYPPRKIEEKIDLLMERRNIKSPAGWLMAALKNDYQGVEPAEQESQPIRIDSRFRGNDIKGDGNDKKECVKNINTPERVSHKKALEAIKLIKDNLSACTSPLTRRESTGVKEDVNQKLIQERRFECPN